MAEVSEDSIMNTLSGVMDPEVPVLSVIDLGVIRDVRINQSHVEVDIAPTYTGCPAMDVISSSVEEAIIKLGVSKVEVNTVLTPPWTTDSVSYTHLTLPTNREV